MKICKMTYQQAKDYNTLLDIKERIEEKYRPKFIINRMPRIKWVTNWEAIKNLSK